MTSQNGKQAFTIQILLNVSRSKGSQIRKFGQLKEHNERIFFFFFGKSYTKGGGEASPTLLYKTSKLSKSPDQKSEML